MHKVRVFEENEKLKILCLGAHADDIEIGCGGTILRLIKEAHILQFYWVVFSGDKKRSREACEGAMAFLKGVEDRKVIVQEFRESFFPSVGAKIKSYFAELSNQFSPDIVFTHCRNDAHQDHRVISALTWNAFRDNLILEYEIPKYDGDLGTPNLYVHLHGSQVDAKIDYLCRVFQTQKKKQWFDEETFRSILRIRGVECNSPSRYAEAFYCRKIVL